MVKDAKQIVENDLQSICNNLTEEFNTLSGKTLLVTGGGGFLGYYLLQAIQLFNRLNDKMRIKVIMLDNFIRGKAEWLAELENDPNIEIRCCDITAPLPKDIEADYIIHAASIASPIYYRKYPLETIDANITGLRNLLEYCMNRKQNNNPVKGFLFYSTSEIYGSPRAEDIPTPETYNGNVSCVGPRACYDESKRLGETLCWVFSQKYDIPVKIARPFNNYGPGLSINDRRVIPDFAKNILDNKDIIMYSDGSPTRTFCYITDAIVGYYKILAKGAAGQAYNIGTDSPEVSMKDLANRCAETGKRLFGYEGKVAMEKSPDKEYLENNPNRRCPVIDKARKQLGYNPVVSLDEGLKRSLIWYNENRE